MNAVSPERPTAYGRIDESAVVATFGVNLRLSLRSDGVRSHLHPRTVPLGQRDRTGRSVELSPFIAEGGAQAVEQRRGGVQ